jgi:hypothetical protein
MIAIDPQSLSRKQWIPSLPSVRYPDASFGTFDALRSTNMASTVSSKRRDEITEILDRMDRAPIVLDASFDDLVGYDADGLPQ